MRERRVGTEENIVRIKKTELQRTEEEGVRAGVSRCMIGDSYSQKG